MMAETISEKQKEDITVQKHFPPLEPDTATTANLNHLKTEKIIILKMEMAEGKTDWWRMDGNDQSMIQFLQFVIGSEVMGGQKTMRFEMMVMR